METQTTANFPKFEQNQILSSSHLNQLRQYLDESNRLTRIRLSGVGIVCGLMLEYNKTTKNILLSAGYGITTEGYLIESDDKVFTHYKTYYDPSDPFYEFGDAITDDGYNENTGHEVSYPEPEENPPARAGSPVLYELLESSSTETKQLLNTLSGIDNMAVVLYLEFIDESLKKCTGTNCDNKGTNRVMTVRALLVSKSDLFHYDREEFYTMPDELPSLNIPRLTNHHLKSVQTKEDLEKLYKKHVHPAAFITKLKDSIDAAYNTYRIRLGLPGKQVQPAKNAIDKIDLNVLYYQYVADGLKDIVVTYNEFAEVAYSFSEECGNTITTFPRHLTVGALVPDETFPYDQYRTVFFDALPPDRNNKILLKAQMLFQKMLQLALCFKIPAESIVDITPGKYVPLTFSDWSIPFYYDPGLLVRAVAGKGNLLKYWNPTQTLRHKERERTAYYSGVFSLDPYFLKPFSFSIEHFPFYRVEGVQGRELQGVLDKLKVLKDDYNLGFKVVAVRVDGPGKLFSFEDCAYGDLQEEYFFHRKKLIDFIDVIYEYMKIAQTYMTGDEAKSVEKVFEFIDPKIAELKDVLPECLKHFDYTAFKSLYKKYFNQFIDLLLATGFLKAIARSLPAKDPTGVKSIDSLVSLLLSLGSRAVYKLIDSIFYNKLYRIYYRYTDRVYRRRLQTRFNKYAELHPGMEHFNSLKNSETLVLVYAKGEVTNFDPKGGGKGVIYMPEESVEEIQKAEAKEAEKQKKKEVDEAKEKKKQIFEELEDFNLDDSDNREKIDEFFKKLKGEVSDKDGTAIKKGEVSDEGDKVVIASAKTEEPEKGDKLSGKGEISDKDGDTNKK